VLDEGVGEGVSVDHVGGVQDRGGDRGIAHVDHGVLVDVGDRGEEGDVEVAPDDRRARQQALGVAAEEGEGVEPSGDEVEYETAEGNVVVPAAAAAAFDEFAAEWGAPETVETNNIGQALAIFQGGNLATFSEDLGGIPIVGEIANKWLEDGGLENTLGLPTGPEQAAPDGAGWIQEFANGTISWIADEDGEFSAEVQEN